MRICLDNKNCSNNIVPILPEFNEHLQKLTKIDLTKNNICNNSSKNYRR